MGTNIAYAPIDIEDGPLTLVSTPTMLRAVRCAAELPQALYSCYAAIDRSNGMKVQIMSPAADRVDFKMPPAPRLSSLEGKTIGLYNNMTGGADIAVERVAEHLSRRYPGVKFERYGGDLRPGRPALSRGTHIDAEEAARMAAEVDAVIGATAH
jgi:hypothetical protein